MFDMYDNFAKIRDFAEISDSTEIGNGVRIGNYVGIGNGAVIGHCVEIGKGAVIRHCVKIGKGAEIGNSAVIGDCVEIGNGAEIGDRVKISDKFRCEGLEVIDFFTMSNVDGTGRRLYVYVHTAGITIRAGCFKGTLDEFCMKAEDEGKYLYSTTVRAAAEAFAAEVRRQGKTGGWDK